MNKHTKYRIRGMIDNSLKVVSIAFMASAIFGTGMYTGAKLCQKYKDPARVFVPDDVPNGDLNGDGMYPDIIINNDGRLIPMYMLEWRKGPGIYGDADEALYNYGNKLSKEDYNSLEKKLNDDFQRDKRREGGFLFNIIQE